MVTSRPWAALVSMLAMGLAAASVPEVQAGGQTPVTRTAQGERVTVSCVAVQATREGREERFVDRAIRDLEKVVADKDTRRYDTYRFLWRGNATIAYEEEAVLRISERYTLFITPLSRDRQGRIRVAVKVEEQPERKERGEDEDGEKPEPVVAVRATSMLVPGNHLKLDGLNLDEGKMIIVVEVRPAR